MNDDVTIVLMAGGQATRLPGKLSLPIDSEPMLLRVYRRLTSSGRPCIVSVRDELPAELARSIHAPLVKDAFADAGPLGGLASAAAQVNTPLLFAAAGDLPNLDARAVDVVVEHYESEKRLGRAPEVVLPRHADGDVEPLAALYTTKVLLEAARRALQAGCLKVTGALTGMRIAYYEIPAVEESRYLNVNTAEDFENVNPS